MKIEFDRDALWITTEGQAEYFLLESFLKKTTNPKLVVDDDNEAKEEIILHLEFESDGNTE